MLLNEKYNYFHFNFCKYSHGKKDYDSERCYSCDKSCPSISNLLWIIPIIKQLNKLFHNIYWNIRSRKYEKEYINEYETTKFKHIWGIKSWDDLSGKECNMNTMNNFDITYHKETDDYTLGVETIYMFKEENGDKDYIKDILNRFTQWMIDNGYDTNKKLNLYQVFTDGTNINSHFKSIEGCYTYFKLLANGYCSL
jgi:hypothetical protein